MSNYSWGNIVPLINYAYDMANNYSSASDSIRCFIGEVGRRMPCDGIILSNIVFEDSYRLTNTIAGISDEKQEWEHFYYKFIKTFLESDNDVLGRLESTHKSLMIRNSSEASSNDEYGISSLYIRPLFKQQEFNSCIIAINPVDYSNEQQIDDALHLIGNNIRGFVRALSLEEKNTDNLEMESLSRLASIYMSMYLIDISEDSYRTISSMPAIEALFDAKYKASAGRQFTSVMKLLADEKDRDNTTAFTDLLTLPLRLYGRNTIDYEFMSVSFGYLRARFIVYSYDHFGSIRKVMFAIEHIDEEKRRENRLRYLSETDLMTGLRNRGSGELRVKQLMEEGHSGYFCLMDVNKFKSINDTYGHAIGDTVLIMVADAIKNTFDRDDVVLRLGGDEFAVFSEKINTASEASVKYQELFKACENISLEEAPGLKVNISLGAYYINAENNVTFEQAYKYADDCMYVGKKGDCSKATFYEE